MEDKGLQKALKIASVDVNYELLPRKTRFKEKLQLYEDKRGVKQGVALTGPHWTWRCPRRGLIWDYFHVYGMIY